MTQGPVPPKDAPAISITGNPAADDDKRRADRLAPLNTVFTALTAITAITAGILAYMAYQNTQEADKRDSIYRELGVQPDLTAYRSGVDRVWAIENNGAGPARIKYLVLVNKQSGRCVDSRTSGDRWGANQNFFIDELREELRKKYSEYFDRKRLKNSDIELVIDGAVFTRSEMISAGKIRNLLKVHARYNPDAFRISTLTEEKNGIDGAMSRIFSEVMESRTLKICYCSASDKFCEKTEGSDRYFDQCKPYQNALVADAARITEDKTAARWCDARSAESKSATRKALDAR